MGKIRSGQKLFLGLFGQKKSDLVWGVGEPGRYGGLLFSRARARPSLDQSPSDLALVYLLGEMKAPVEVFDRIDKLGLVPLSKKSPQTQKLKGSDSS